MATAPDLGTAGSFAVLGGSTVTNTGPTSVSGNLGVSPGSAVTGFPPGTVAGGTIHAADAVAEQAQADATTAYGDLAGQACDVTYTLAEDIGGDTLAPGVHCFPSSAFITGALTLDAQGDPSAVWVFDIESTLITAPGASVLIINGGNACNVFWRVGSSATLDTTTDFKGNILALANIAVNTGATVSGRLLAQVEAVTMDTNVIAIPTNCAPPPPAGNIIIGVQTNPDGSAAQFAFTSQYGPFTLGDGGSNDSGNQTPGIYNITQTVPPGWNLTSIVCTSLNGSTTTVDLPNGTVEVDLVAGDTVTCVFNMEEEAPPIDICLDGAADYQRTVILGKGMGNDNKHKTSLKLTIPNWQTVDSLYGQLVGEQNGEANYVQFIYPDQTYSQVNVLTSPAYRRWATFWYGADLNPAATITGRWFLKTTGTKGHIPRAFLLYPTYHTTEPYVNVFDPLAFDESIKNHVYYKVSAGWIAAQQYRMAIPAPQLDVTMVVQVALAENDKDNRVLRLTVSADGATPQTVSPNNPSHGDLLNIVTFNFPIKAGTDEIVLDLVSPSPNGDSGAMIGAAAYYACQPDID
ncbi:ice-binding family protein [Candidatus Promineifilum breve]|uniref:ice-binding family protein n=1 Tax=Candidatus Promineifilum breve TaxID=1806508 RepID=UPI0018D53C1E|nr:ice-binding family protein [Candidatus Promineifilum breve]